MDASRILVLHFLPHVARVCCGRYWVGRVVCVRHCIMYTMACMYVLCIAALSACVHVSCAGHYDQVGCGRAWWRQVVDPAKAASLISFVTERIYAPGKTLPKQTVCKLGSCLAVCVAGAAVMHSK
jgi:hypothetical protein